MIQSGRSLRNLIADKVGPIVAGTRWRNRRLLILGYHGVSFDDEHLWDGRIYMCPAQFRRRLEILKAADCHVLPLTEALAALRADTLPPRAVSLTVDDGFHDFAEITAPILAEFGYKASVYVSSYYAQFNRPIFDMAVPYLLWKGRGQTLRWRGVIDEPVLLDGPGRHRARWSIVDHAFEHRYTGARKDKLLAELADVLHLDYAGLCRRRLLHMMNAKEAGAMHRQGHEMLLHTHRHRVSRNRALFEREIHDNRSWLENAIGQTPNHLSFPGGVWQPVARHWLETLGIESGLTCTPGLASEYSDVLRLPRFVDSALVPERAFRAWIYGSMQFFPQGRETVTAGQILEESISQPTEEAMASAAAGR